MTNGIQILTQDVKIGEKRCRVIIALDGQQFVASCQIDVEKHAYHIRSLFVSESHRRGGIGRRLVAEAERFIAGDGGRAMSLWVNPDNQPACRLYDSLGFVAIYESKETPPEVFMAKKVAA